MSLPVDGVGAWRANVERANPIRAADPAGGGALLSPWQALMATATLARTSDSADGAVPEWRARVEPGPVAPMAPERTSPPGPAVTDDPTRIETAGLAAKPPRAPNADETAARETKPDAQAAEPPGLFQDGEFSFADLIDVINPLQHIPVVGTIYRELTGDRIGHGARLAGGVLFMGPVGGLTALANIVSIEASGKDIGEHALALLKDDSAPATAIAANVSKPEPNAAFARAPGTEEIALAELLPPGAIPISGSSVEFTGVEPAQAARRPERGAEFNTARGDSPARPAALAPALTPAPVAVPAPTDNDLPPPPPPSGPIAGPGWKGFHSPPEPQPEIARPVPAAAAPAQRALAPDPLAQLAAKRTPGTLAGAMAAPAGAIGVEGGWFSDVMIEALAKYEDARRLREPQPPEAARQGGVNIVN
jgi:hypothetical protein